MRYTGEIFLVQCLGEFTTAIQSLKRSGPPGRDLVV
jgi:hypothetical protein